MARIAEPQTSYERMVFVALVKKLRANLSTKKKSARDTIREHNPEGVQLRTLLGKASHETHVMVYDEKGNFIERRLRDSG